MPVELLKSLMEEETNPVIFTRFEPGREVSPWVREYFLYERPGDEAAEPLFSDGLPTLIFPLDNSVGRVTQGRRIQRLPGAYLVGPLMEAAWLRNPGQLRLLGVRLSYEGLYHLLRHPVRELRTRSCRPLEEVLGYRGRRLTQSLARTTFGIEDKIRCIEQFIREAGAEPGQPDGLFRQALFQLSQSPDEGNIAQLTHALRVNYKWLERRFGRYLGLSPKEFALQYRFLRAYLQLEGSRGRDVLDVTTRYGYYDQNHFNKEFKRFTGQTPGRHWKGVSHPSDG